MEDQLLKATKMIENQVDAEIQRMDKMDEDGFEELRRDRMEQLKVQIFRIFYNIISYNLYLGICQRKCHFGFSKSSKFKRVVLLVLMTFCVYVQ